MAESFQNEVPKARINLKLDLHTGGAGKKTELPLKLLVAGDFSNGQDASQLSERKKVNLDKNNFDSVLSEYSPKVNLTVKNTLAGDGSEENISLTFRSIRDFSPEQISRQIPQLKAMLSMRNLLRDLKANLLDNPPVRPVNTMSVKSQFLEKLQTRQSAPASSVSKSQADIAEFCQRMAQLQEQMDAWLVGAGLNVGTVSTSVTDLLVEGGTFEIDALVLRIDDRSVKFMPVFLYGQGVTGCVEVTFHNGAHVTPLGRLFMRSSTVNNWTFVPPGALSPSGLGFDESTFFGLILALLP